MTLSGPPARSSAAIIASLARSPLDTYVRLAARYGDTVRVPLGPRSAWFLLSRPEHAEHVLAARQDSYVKAFTYKPLRALIGDGLLTSEGETWRQHRRLVQPVFSRRDVLRFAPAISEATRRLLRDWAQQPDGARLDVAAQLAGLALDVVGSALFGTDLAGDARQMSKAMAAGQKVAMAATFLPLTWGPRSVRAVRAAAVRLSRTPDGIDGPVGRLIAQRQAAPRAGGPGDLLDVLLAAGTDDCPPLPPEAVRAEVATFLLAGHETSANALAWTLALLSAYPAARARLEEEVDTVLAGREPAAADLPSLPWTGAVISEAMRLYPPAWTIERDAVTADDVAGVRVPAGSLVAVPPYLVHRNPEFWPDPAGFDPARFLGHADRPRYAYIPFGGGRRACVGQSFAELETTLVLASIAQQFRLELGPAGIPRPAAYVTLRPGGGLPMRLTRR